MKENREYENLSRWDDIATMPEGTSFKNSHEIMEDYNKFKENN